LKPVAAATHSGVVGVLATTGTLESARLAALVDRFAADEEIVAQPCPSLGERIERGELDTPGTRALVAGFVAPGLARGPTPSSFGCTQFPFVRAAEAARRLWPEAEPVELLELAPPAAAS
jgi:glutamate racemase